MYEDRDGTNCKDEELNMKIQLHSQANRAVIHEEE